MKKLMVLGAGFPQVRLMNAAKELGYKTVVCSIPGEYPGFDVADEIAYADISNENEVLEAAKKYEVDGVATCCLDTGIKALGYTCERLGFVGLSDKAATCSADKWMMKKAFMDAGVSTAKCYRIENESELNDALKVLQMPVILKAVDLQGSKGIYICQNESEVRENYKNVLALTRKDFCIIEEFIEGDELGAQAFVYKGEILFVLPHGDNTYMSHTAVPVGHYVPLEGNEQFLDAVVEESKKAIRAIGLDNCAVNIDLIEKNGKIYVIELTGRAGATCLPELVSIYYGLDYYRMIATMAMGGNPIEIFENREGRDVANASMMLLSEQSGTIKKIIDNVEMNENIYEYSLIVKEGDYVNKFTNAKDRIGQIIVKAPTYKECKEKIAEIQSKIELVLE